MESPLIKIHRFDQFMRFASIGAIATTIQYAVLVLLVSFFQINPVLASGIGFTISAFSNYLLNYHLTFQSRKRHSEAAPRFIFLVLIGILLNTAVMWALTETMSLHYVVAQIFATGLVLVWNFLGNSMWTFREHETA